MNERLHIATAVAALGDEHASRDRVLEALETIMQFDRDEALRAHIRRRYCDLTEQKDQVA